LKSELIIDASQTLLIFGALAVTLVVRRHAPNY
jgi:hypothetical protein